MPRKHLFTTIDSLFGPEPSPVMHQIIQTIERVALSDLGILITGEQGTGKDWLARMIHSLSGRANYPLANIDCTSIVHDDVERTLFGWQDVTGSGVERRPGLLERLAGGTLVINKISDLPTVTQMKIVRTFEHQHYRRPESPEHVTVNVRMIATMRKKPGEAMQEGEIGKEIYHRICPVIINLPPLRERKEDIPFLIEHFINESSIHTANRPKGITADALTSCLAYDWPGNVRELKNVVDFALDICSEQFIRRHHLPKNVSKASGKNSTVTAASLAH